MSAKNSNTKKAFRNTSIVPTLRQSAVNSVLKFVCRLLPIPSSTICRKALAQLLAQGIQTTRESEMEQEQQLSKQTPTRSVPMQASARFKLTLRKSRQGLPEPEGTTESLGRPGLSGDAGRCGQELIRGSTSALRGLASRSSACPLANGSNTWLPCTLMGPPVMPSLMAAAEAAAVSSAAGEAAGGTTNRCTAAETLPCCSAAFRIVQC